MNYNFKEIKQRAIEKLNAMLPAASETLRRIDERLLDYYQQLSNCASIDPDDENDLHCCMELLCGIRTLRLMNQYIVDEEAVQTVLRLREGEWHLEGKQWVYDRGGILLPGTGNTKQHYRWEPFQVYIWATIYGLKAWVDTDVENGTRKLIPTEREGKNGTIEDLRRLCTDYTLFGPRKIDKTGINAFDNVLHFMSGSYNSEIYCTANTEKQSKLLYDRTCQILRELDPLGKRIRFTQTCTKWKPNQLRSAELLALSAGGKTKDGLFAEKCAPDEYGSAPYVNGKSDMGALVSVVQSSMGPRREPLTLTTTTAGRINTGPFIEKLDGIKRALIAELDAEVQPNPDHVLLDASDRWSALILEPDEWERDEEFLFNNPRIRKKINPMLGKIVQHSFYDDEISKARMDNEKRVETIVKLFNVYRTDKVKDWVVTGDRIRRLQQDKRVTDCLYQDGWDTFIGLDFSGGDDLYAMASLSVNRRNAALAMNQRFFADTLAWISEAAFNKSPNRPLYEKWIDQGWLRLCPGEVFNPDLAIHELMNLNTYGVNLTMFGYDPAQSKQPINTLKAWLQSLGIDFETIKNMVIPVPQNYMTFNPLVGEVEYYTTSQDAWLRFSNSPLWPWCFSNCQVVESKEGLRKLLKSGVENKIDPVHALCDSFYCFDLSEGRM